MKVNKKVIGLVLAGMLSIGVVGCGNSTVENSQVPQQEQQIQDEDLNQEYLEQSNENHLQKAKELIQQVAEQTYGANGTKYEVLVQEDSNTVVLIINMDSDTVAYGINTNQWDDLTSMWVEMTSDTKSKFKELGWNDVNFTILVGDIDEDKCYFNATNGLVVYDVKDEINK